MWASLDHGRGAWFRLRYRLLGVCACGDAARPPHARRATGAGMGAGFAAPHHANERRPIIHRACPHLTPNTEHRVQWTDARTTGED